MNRTVFGVCVAALLAVIYLVVGPNVLSRVDDQRRQKAQAEISLISNHIEQFRDQEGHYPRSISDLAEKNYLESTPSDPWGRPYDYSLQRPALTNLKMPFYVWSLGADGQSGGAKANSDLGNWSAQDRS